MPVQHAVWRVGEPPTRLEAGKLASEQLLEDMIVADPSILSGEWMLIGRQEPTSFGGRVDLLAIAPDGSLVLIELKRNRTPREIMAQALDYACWVEQLEPERIARIYQRFSEGGDLGRDFRERFGADLDEDSVNQAHQLIIVAAELDDATERIVRYLNERDIAINIAFFRVFQHGGDQLLSRAWLIDPGETQINVSDTARAKVDREPWNGEYYVSYGPTTARSWEDARKYGFISAGGGRWYSQTLKLLSPGDRIWVNIPKTGYVGVGEVTESMAPVGEFEVATNSGNRTVLEVLENAERYRPNAEDEEKREYFVRVNWLATVPESEAVSEVGFFGNQNTVCQPTTPKWRHTVERLKAKLPGWQGSDHGTRNAQGD